MEVMRKAEGRDGADEFTARADARDSSTEEANRIAAFLDVTAPHAFSTARQGSSNRCLYLVQGCYRKACKPALMGA
jgi:hypothetical protein